MLGFSKEVVCTELWEIGFFEDVIPSRSVFANYKDGVTYAMNTP
jgi:hypothetical protein